MGALGCPPMPEEWVRLVQPNDWPVGEVAVLTVGSTTGEYAQRLIGRSGVTSDGGVTLRIERVGSPQAAWMRLARAPVPDVLLIDSAAHGAAAIALVEIVRQDPRLEGMITITTSAAPNTESACRALAAGCDVYLGGIDPRLERAVTASAFDW